MLGFGSGLGRRASYPFLFGTCAAEVRLISRVFDQSLVEVVADPFALETNEVYAIDAFIDFFPIEYPTLQFFGPNP